MKRFLKVTGIIIFGLVLIIGLSGYFFVKNFDLNQYKSYVEELATKQLGRKLVINGNASIGISLIPTLVVEDVELANADWASQPQMVKIKSLEIKLSLMPLIHKQVVIDRVVLISPEVYLEVAQNGKANWDFSKPAQRIDVEKVLIQHDETLTPEKQQIIEKVQHDSSNPAAAVLAGFAAKNVSIENGIVEYNDHKSGDKINVIINRFSFNEDSMDDDINAAFDVVYNGQKMSGKATLGSINTFLAGNLAYPFDATINAYGADLAAKGTVRDVMSNLSYATDVNFYNPGGNMGAPETTLKGYVEGTVKQVKVDIKLLNIVNNIITGRVSADISGKIPFINADLRSDLINLANFSSNSNFAFVIPSLIGTANASQLVPNTPIPYAEMNKVNAKAALDVKKLVIQPGMEANNVILQANLQNGVLAVNPLKLNFGGGDIAGDLTVNANTQTIGLNVASQNIVLQNLHQEFAVGGPGDFGIVSGGNTDIKINLTGNGNTYRQLVQTLSGQVIAIVNKSVVQTGNITFMTGNFLSQLLNVLPFAQKGNQQLDLQCAVLRADLGGGQAVFPKGIAVDSSSLKLVSNGNINLVNDKINFDIRPFSGKVVDTNVAQALSSFIKVKGTLENPKVTIDDKEALKSIVGVALTGPAYLGSKMVLDADPAPCYMALKGTSFQNKFPAPTAAQSASQDVYNGANDVVDGGVTVVKDTAKDLKTVGKDTAKQLEGAAKDIINIFKNQGF